MAIYLVKCPDCGSPTELNDEKEYCFCTECGKRIPRDDAELYVPDPGADSPAEPTEPAAEPADVADAPVGGGVPDDPSPVPAPDPVPALTLDPVLAVDDGVPAPMFSEAAETFNAAAENNAEHLSWLVSRQPQPLDSVVFHSSDECAAYVTALHDLISEAQLRYSKMNHLEEATCLDYLDRAIGYCDLLDTKRLRFLAGTHVEKGKNVEDYGSYPVSKDILKDIKQAREDFLEAYNGFFKPKIAAAKATLDDTKQKIRDLPASMRFYHAFCTPVMGILTAILLAVGIFAVVKGGAGLTNIAILAVGAILFVAWAVLMVLWLIRGAGARQLYKAAERQANEARTYRAKLKS